MLTIFWGNVKNGVYKIPVTTREETRKIVKVVFQNINFPTASNVGSSFENRIQDCINVMVKIEQ